MPKVTPKDFFLWIGAMVSLYGSAIALIVLLFEYIDRIYPDPLEYYVDPYSGAIRFAMASLIVLTPTAVFLLRLIRADIAQTPEKTELWVRRWALMLTVFIAGATVAGDLIALINTFLGGELTTRFVLKVLVIFGIAGGVFLHFLADLRGYWTANQGRARAVGWGVEALVIAILTLGFFIMGTPNDVRLLRYDNQKLSDLQNIQSQVVNYWQLKRILPVTLEDLRDPLSGFIIPTDPQTGADYEYRVVNPPYTFELCATFNLRMANEPTNGGIAKLSVPRYGPLEGEVWEHGVGRHCFERTIDPERYPPLEKSLLR